MGCSGEGGDEQPLTQFSGRRGRWRSARYDNGHANVPVGGVQSGRREQWMRLHEQIGKEKGTFYFSLAEDADWQ
jgi:hypothetical protein